MFGRKKPPVIAPHADGPGFDRPAPDAYPRGGERDFIVERDTRPGAPWLSAGLILGASAALFGASINYDFLLGQLLVPIIGLATAHGLLRGGFRKLIMLPATIFVIAFLATNPTIADPIVQRITGGPSVIGNWIACAVIATLSLVILALPVKAIRNRLIMRRPLLRGADRMIGTGVGFAEGAFAALLVMWGTVLLEPHARSVSNHAGAQPAQQKLAAGILRLATEIDATPLAPIIRDANLLEEFPAIRQQLGAIRSDGTLDPMAMDPGTRESLIKILESFDTAEAKSAAESLRKIGENQSRKPNSL